MFNRYITLDGKRYAVIDPQYEPVIDRMKTYTKGLTGKSIIQDFTVEDRVPKEWIFRLRAFISETYDPEYGLVSDLEAAYHQPYVTFTEHDDSKNHLVGILSPIRPVPQVGANIEGHCYGVAFIDVTLEKIFL